MKYVWTIIILCEIYCQGKLETIFVHTEHVYRYIVQLGKTLHEVLLIEYDLMTCDQHLPRITLAFYTV